MKREISLDIIRSFAIICVIGVHSYSTPHEYCFIQSILRTLSVLGVPLFLLLSGYLTSNKSLTDYYSKGKWKTIIPNYCAYLLLGSICFITPKIVFNESFSIFAYLKSLLNFQCTPYGWYMEMWIGLFFLTPFINIILNNISKKQELYFILTLIACSQIASFVNRNGNIFIPSYWQSLWPFSLFAIGHYIKTYKFSINNKISLIIFTVGITSEYIINKLIHTTSNYIYFFGGHNMVIYLLLGTILFIQLNQIKNINNNLLRKVVLKSSQLSFFIYLISAAFDKTIYRIIEPAYFINQTQFLPYRIAIHLLTFILSFIAAWAYSKIDYKIKKMIQY